MESVFKAFTGEESDDEEDKDVNPPTLKDFYKVGDGVIGTIVAVQSGTEGKKRKRLELSLIPAQVNADLNLDDLEVGMMIPGEIKSIEDRGYVIDLGLEKVAGFLAFGAQDSEKMATGSVVHCRVTAKNRAVVTLELSRNEVNKAGGLKNYNSLRPGTLVENVEIKAIHEGLLNVMINETHMGQVDIFNLPVPRTLANPKTNAPGITSNYFVGMKIPAARIVFADCHVGADEKSLILSALPSVLSSDKVRREIEAIPDETAAIGTKFEEARIVRVDPGLGIILALDSEGTEFAQVHISRLSDEKITKIVAPYRQNSLHACRIIDYDPFAAIAIASMAPSCLNQQFLSIDSIPVGSVVRGEVTTITPGLGILVNLSERIRALCPINQLTETQSQDALKSFRLGQKFKFRVLSTDPSSRRVMLTRKKGLIESEIEPLCDYKDAVVGQFYDGYVASIRPFGCIVRFFGDVKAILPLGELTEETFVKDAKEVVFEGQVVRCRVIRLDKEAQSMAVSLRKTDTPKTGKRKMTTEEPKVKVNEKKPKTEIIKVEITEKVAKPAESEVSEEYEDEPVEVVSKPQKGKSTSVQSPPVTPEKVQVKAVLPSLRQLEEEELAKEEMLMNFETSVTSQKEVNAEDLLSMKEMCEEFERRLLGSPNSSVLWIQYMSVLIKSMELDAARALAQRALQTISIRAEAEKLNIWIALMNLEHAYGTAVSLKATFERACVYNDSKAVHLALASIYEETARADQPETIKTVEEFYNSVLLKKFRQSCKVWMNLAQFYFTVKKDTTSARKLLPKALEALPRRKHMKATLKFAQMEFRHGNLERGRTLFEGLIASFPSRLDIWSQFCGQEERHLPETTENLRNLYTRIVHLKLSSKKAKFFFKKFLEFEKQYGDQLTVQNVKDLAQKYVESSMTKN